MALPLPRSLSPSKVSSFKSCPLSFRFANIDKLPEATTIHQLRGTLVHSVLERFFWEVPSDRRNSEAVSQCLDLVWGEVQGDADLESLTPTESDRLRLRSDIDKLVRSDLELEDPKAVNAVGVEIMLEAEIDGALMRGIIDRLDITDGGDLVVIDYKTGRVPSPTYYQTALQGVNLYALLCEKVLGEPPRSVRLHYLSGPAVIESNPTPQSVKGTRIRAGAVWKAIGRACETEDFRPKPSALCKWCSFTEFCPAVGGKLALLDNHS